MKKQKKAGAQGATILHGRGSGAHQKEKFFSLSIDPEKDVVLIIAKEDTALAVSDHLDKAMGFSKPNSGVLASVSLQSVVGLMNT